MFSESSFPRINILMIDWISSGDLSQLALMLENIVIKNEEQCLTFFVRIHQSINPAIGKENQL